MNRKKWWRAAGACMVLIMIFLSVSCFADDGSSSPLISEMQSEITNPTDTVQSEPQPLSDSVIRDKLFTLYCLKYFPYEDGQFAKEAFAKSDTIVYGAIEDYTILSNNATAEMPAYTTVFMGGLPFSSTSTHIVSDVGLFAVNADEVMTLEEAYYYDKLNMNAVYAILPEEVRENYDVNERKGNPDQYVTDVAPYYHQHPGMVHLTKRRTEELPPAPVESNVPDRNTLGERLEKYIEEYSNREGYGDREVKISLKDHSLGLNGNTGGWTVHGNVGSYTVVTSDAFMTLPFSATESMGGRIFYSPYMGGLSPLGVFLISEDEVLTLESAYYQGKVEAEEVYNLLPEDMQKGKTDAPDDYRALWVDVEPEDR